MASLSWQTPTNTVIASVSEGSAFSYQLVATGPYPITSYSLISGVLPLNVTLNTTTGLLSGVVAGITVTQDFDFVVSVTDNSNDVIYGTFGIVVLNDVLPPVWNPIYSSVNLNNLGTFAINNQVNIQLQANDASGSTLSFYILNGSLPGALSLNSSGLISGVLVPSNTVVPADNFQFTVRVTNGIQYSDRSFLMNVQEPNEAPIWLNSSFLGAFLIGEYIEIQLQAYSPNARTLTFTLASGQLPIGLILSPTGLISGSILPVSNTYVSAYDFTVSVFDQITLVLRTFEIDITQSESNPLLSDSITWQTNSGNLGSIYESYPSYFEVSALSSLNNEIMYSSQAAGISATNDLPPGLSLDSATGLITGIVGYPGVNTTYTFSIIASTATLSSNRTFSITVLATNFSGIPISTVSMQVSGFQKLNWDFYLNDLTYIPAASIFRSGDLNYGLNFNPNVYIIGGFSISSSLDFWDDITTPPDYTARYAQKTFLYVGPINWALARDPTSGADIYEVLYRTIIDPLQGVGGFSSTGSPMPIYQGTTQLFPPSINNMREDIINNLGVKTEQLPLWMSSPQVLNEPSSTLSYVPALVIAYVVPGTAAGIVAKIKQNEINTKFMGEQLTFDRYLLTTITEEAGTGFDQGTTLFDGGSLIFDETTNPQSYFLFPPG